MAEEELITDDELYEHYSFKAGKGQEPLRVDKFLMNFVENASRNKVQQAAKDGNIFVNGVAVKANHRVKANDEVKVMFAHPPHEYLLVPEPIPLDIVYEDEELIIINKPAGLVVHPGHGNYQGTLINGLIYHFEHLPKNSSDRPGLVHRIDKDTSGLLVVAKTEEAMNHLAKQFFNKTSEREYVALVWGNLPEDEATITGSPLKNRFSVNNADIRPSKPPARRHRVHKNAVHENNCGRRSPAPAYFQSRNRHGHLFQPAG